MNEIATGGHGSSVGLARRLWREYVRAYWGRLALAVLSMGVVAAATAAAAWLMKPVVNEIFVARNPDMLLWVGGAVLATFTIKGIASYVQSVLISHVGLRVVADAQNRLFAHLAQMDLAFFQANATGGLISRFTNDINTMRGAVANALVGFGKDALSLVGLVVVMFLQDLQLALFCFVVFPIAVFPIVRLGRRMRDVTAGTQAELGQFTTLLEQTIQGIRLVKAYGMEAYETNRIQRLVERIFGLSMRSARVRAASSPIMETLGGVAVAMGIFYGGWRVIHGGMDAGAFFSFITALLLAYEPMKKIANLNASLQEGLASAERLFALLDIQPRIQDKPGAQPLVVKRGAVRLDGVSFRYGGDRRALPNVTLEAPAGQTVALVGHSGAGKSTILNLIPRFFDIEAGAVTIDGTDVRDVTMASIFQAVGLVSQEITLFDDTVRANIAYGKPGATDAEIEAAARDAGADTFVRELPEGYGTIVGEQGVKLSGGQRQRLAIARAMLKRAPILLLDEATSSLDTESERHVQAALDTLKRGRTTLVIAHRLSTVIGADIIYVIEGGRIVESGSHRELLARGGAYARLYALQFAAEPAADTAVQAM